MDDLSGWTMTSAKRQAPKLEYRVAGLIAAVVCTAFIGNACLEASRPVPQPASALGGKTEHKLPADRPVEGVRLRPAAPVEFAAVYGLAAEKPYTTLAAAEWSTPAPASRTPRKVAQACPGECGPTIAAVVPPRRPADLTVIAQAPTPDEDKRVRLLGVSLPGFVPSGETIARTVVSWGGSIAGVIPGL